MKKKPNYEILFFLWKRRKNLLTMKLLLCFILFSMLNVSGSIFSQSATFDLAVNGKTVKEVFKDIESQSQYRFLYNDDFAGLHRVVSFNTKDNNIDEVLGELLAGANLSYRELENDLIVITPMVVATQKQISGIVRDNQGELLPGVSVSVQGTTIGTITDLDGNFRLDIPEDAGVLVFSFVGMVRQEVVIGEQRVFDITMQDERIGLDEVVVVGYGTQRRINLTGSLSIINADDLAEVSMPTLAHSLMGRSSGVFIKNRQGQPGEVGLDINIRGFGTPLIIVDGMPVSLEFFHQIEAEDIESLNVLKDASAAAVYGARAGNGVILVETKRGRVSAPEFNYSGNYGLQYFINVPTWVNSYQYASMYNVGLVYAEDKPARWTDEEVQKYKDGSDPAYPNNDFWKRAVRDFAPQQQHNLSIRGGTERIKYFSSINFFNQKGMHVSDDTDYNRFSLRSNLDVQLTDKLSVGVDLTATNQWFLGPSITFERKRETWEGFSGNFNIDSYMNRFLYVRPIEPIDVHPDPTKLPVMMEGKNIDPYIMGFIDNVGYNKWSKLYGFAKLNFEYELPYNFRARATFDLNNTFHRDKFRMLRAPQYEYIAETDEYIERKAIHSQDFLKETNRIYTNFNRQYFLMWDKDLENHQFNALFGHETLYDNYDFFTAVRRNYIFDIDYLSAGPDLNQDNRGLGSEGGRKAFIGRINYNYKGKYLLEISGRADGSPKFPAETRWGYFPSASVGWRISEEPFFSDNLSFISNLKVRASHGLLGYDRAGSFQYLTTYSIRSQYISSGGVFDPGLRSDGLPNPLITWEKMAITNLGLDFDLFRRGLLGGSIDYFYRLRTDVLGRRIGSVPDVVGATLPDENIYEYDNRGWELTLSHFNRIGDFSYSINGNVATNREKTVFRDQAEFATKEAYRRGNLNGEWTDRFWAYPTDGLFHSQEEIDNWADIDGQGNRTIKPGDIKYIDYNNDGRITSEDMIVAGRGSTPRLMYGLDMSMNWKGFNVSMLWQGAGLYNYNIRGYVARLFFSEGPPISYAYHNNYTPENPWMPANTTNAKWPRYGTDNYNRRHTNWNRNNQHWLVDGFYIRLKNVQLGYTIPPRITNRYGINNLKVFVAGYDVLTFVNHDYDFVDPEIDHSPSRSFGVYHPIVGSYNFGIQMNF